MARFEDSKPKEMWDHFTPEEMQVIAAYIYGFQKLPKFQRAFAQELNRVWVPGERFFMAVRAISDFFENNPNTGLSFVIADYDKNNSRISSGDRRIDPREIEKTKVVYLNIINWNEKALQEYVDGLGGFTLKKYGFPMLKDGELAPMEMEKRTITTDSIDKIAKEFKETKTEKEEEPKEKSEEPKKEEPESPTIEPKRRGRPPKQV